MSSVAPELVARLESERIPCGEAFTWHEGPQLAIDTPALIAERRSQLEAAEASLSPHDGRRSCRRRLQAVA